ncbi:hypothetical protein TKK_0009468 [Trichogramma kaykai]
MGVLYQDRLDLSHKISNPFSNFKKIGNAKMTIGQTKAKIKQIEECRDLFQTNNSKVRELDHVDRKHAYFEKQLFELTQETFFSVYGDYQDHLYSLESATSKSKQQNPMDFMPCFLNLSSLPAITIPTFKDVFDQWENFRDVFKALIHSKKEINAIIKYQHFRTLVKNEAFDLIKNIPLTAESYDKA